MDYIISPQENFGEIVKRWHPLNEKNFWNYPCPLGKKKKFKAP